MIVARPEALAPRAWPNRGQGAPGSGAAAAVTEFKGLGKESPLHAGGLAVERRLKEVVSKRGRRAACPLTDPRGLKSECCDLREF